MEHPQDRPIAWILILIALAIALALAVAAKKAPQASAPPAAIACGGCIINDPPPPPPPYWPPKLLFFPLFRNQPAGETGEAVEWTPTPEEEEIGPPAYWTPTTAALALASATPTPRR